jgi:hypothetical protein
MRPISFAVSGTGRALVGDVNSKRRMMQKRTRTASLQQKVRHAGEQRCREDAPNEKAREMVQATPAAQCNSASRRPREREDFRLGNLFSLFDEIVETSLIDQLHDKIKLTMVAPKRENLHDMRMIHRGSDARFLLQLRGVTRFGIAPQKFQRDEAIQSGASRFVNRTHSTDTECFYEDRIVECTFDAKFFSAFRTGDAGKRLGVARIDLLPAGRASLHSRGNFAFRHQAILTSAPGGAIAAAE